MMKIKIILTFTQVTIIPAETQGTPKIVLGATYKVNMELQVTSAASRNVVSKYKIPQNLFYSEVLF